MRPLACGEWAPMYAMPRAWSMRPRCVGSVGDEELAEEGGVAVEILGGTEAERPDRAGGVIDRPKQRELRAAGFEPGEGTAVHLQESAAGGFAHAPAAVTRGPARPPGGPPQGPADAADGFPAHRQAVDLPELFGEVHVVKADVGGRHELGDLGAERGRQPSRRGLAAALVAQGRGPAFAKAAPEALELPDGELQRLGALAVGDPTGEGRLDQPSPGQLLLAHRESLHRGMTLSRSSYPMTFSCSTSIVRPAA